MSYSGGKETFVLDLFLFTVHITAPYTNFNIILAYFFISLAYFVLVIKTLISKLKQCLGMRCALEICKTVHYTKANRMLSLFTVLLLNAPFIYQTNLQLSHPDRL